MHGDFSRDPLARQSNITALLQQQGRLLLDSDWNEQAAILLGYLRQLAADVIGWHGGPEDRTPKIDSTNPVSVKGGQYYVDGRFIELPDIPVTEFKILNEKSTAVNKLYILDMCERHVTSSNMPRLLDPALDGHDTTTRLQLVPRILVLKTAAVEAGVQDEQAVRELEVTGLPTTKKLDSRPIGNTALLPTLRASTSLHSTPAADCGGDARGGFIGLENQLYRIEIHRGGTTFWDGVLDDKKKPKTVPETTATLKWSRDNGSVTYPSKKVTVSGQTVTIEFTTRVSGLKVNNWIEIIPPNFETGILARVEKETDMDSTVIAKMPEPGTEPDEILKAIMESAEVPMVVRRWDHQHRKDFPLHKGAMLFTKNVIPIEDGLQIEIALPADGEFRAGDYWLVPTRSSTGNVIWPTEVKDGKKLPMALPATYAEHYYAPLAIEVPTGAPPTSLVRTIAPIAKKV